MTVKCPICHSGNYLTKYPDQDLIVCENENCTWEGEPEELESE